MLRQHIDEDEIVDGAWVFGNGYDDSQLAEARHPNRYELDAVSTTHPIFLMHISGHLAAANSLALETVGFTADANDPAGGRIWRDESGEPNGIVDEQAVFTFLRYVTGSPEDLIPKYRDASLEFASFGITTAQEGQTQQHALPLLRAAAAAGHVLIDVVAYPKWTEYQQMLESDPIAPGTYLDHVKVNGVKITQDGSPQGKTAYLSEPYLNPPEGEGVGYRGHPILLHCNGDACAEMMFEAVDRASSKHGNVDRRPVMIHAQTLRIDQLEEMKKLGIIPSFFPAHTFFWGDWHRDEVLGPERAKNISPTMSDNSQRRTGRSTQYHFPHAHGSQ
jgi:predicted amidohydrolase YtcJ